MYHILLTDEDGDAIVDTKSNSVVLLYNTDGGVAATTLLESDLEDQFRMVLTIDCVKNQMLERRPLLKLIYKMKKKIIKGITSVDIGLLHDALERREGASDDDAE